METHEALNDLGERTQLMLKWIKAHNNYKGNDIADEEAKLGTNKPVLTNLPLPKREVYNIIEEHTRNLWQEKWKKNYKKQNYRKISPYCRQRPSEANNEIMPI